MTGRRKKLVIGAVGAVLAGVLFVPLPLRIKPEGKQAAVSHAITALLLSHREKIRHPHPELAIEFGLVAVASILQNVILEEEPLHRLPMTEHLHDELVRLFLRYLGINEG